MKSLIITVAGMSSRFNRDTNKDVLKCLYFEDTPSNSLLSLQVYKVSDYVEEIIIVGGYKYEDLERFIRGNMKDVSHKIKLVYNDHFYDYGSGYSLLMGIRAVSDETDEIVFIEGDLFFDAESIERLFMSSKDVITVNREPILSSKAVALYFDTEAFPHYIYDTNHSCLEIKEPFMSIYNSGQMWKFMDPARLKEIGRFLTPEQEKGTNLVIIQEYFGTYKSTQLDLVSIDCWFNCNTVIDYRDALKALCV